MMKFVDVKKKQLECLSVLALASVVLFLFFSKVVLVWFAAFFLIVGLFVKPLGQVIAFLWLRLGEIIGEVVSTVILTLVYYFVLTPFALMYRLMNKKNKMLMQKDKNSNSYFVERNQKYFGRHLEKPW